MSAPAPAALQNLRSLVFRDHALNLKQKIIFRRAANRMVQKNDIRARPVKLLDDCLLYTSFAAITIDPAFSIVQPIHASLLFEALDERPEGRGPKRIGRPPKSFLSL